MLYLYLDESGDLGFDFVNKKPSRFFTITIMSVRGTDRNRQIINTVKRTLRRKINPVGKRNRLVQEIKASKTEAEIKKYFLRQLVRVEFDLYSLTLNKRRVYESLTREKDRVYNFIARLVLDQITFGEQTSCVNLIIDRSKGKKEIEEFDEYIKGQLKGRLDPNKTKLIVEHRKSEEMAGIQAVDTLSWAIFKKYESKNARWIDIIKDKLKYEKLYLE